MNNIFFICLMIGIMSLPKSMTASSYMTPLWNVRHYNTLIRTTHDEKNACVPTYGCNKNLNEQCLNAINDLPSDNLQLMYLTWYEEGLGTIGIAARGVIGYLLNTPSKLRPAIAECTCNFMQKLLAKYSSFDTSAIKNYTDPGTPSNYPGRGTLALNRKQLEEFGLTCKPYIDLTADIETALEKNKQVCQEFEKINTNKLIGCKIDSSD